MGLQISRVATVDEGDNPEARIVLFKRRPETTAADAAGEDEGMGKDITQELPDEVKAQFAAVEQAKVEAEEAKTAALEEVETLKARVAELEKAAESEEEKKPDPVEKADPEVKKLLEDAKREAEEANAKVAKMEDDKATERAMQTVAKWSLPNVTADDFAPVIKRLRGYSAEDAEKVEKALDDADAALRESAAFKELGTDAEGTDLEQKVRKMAEERVGDGKTLAQAETEIWNEHPDWYDKHRDEQGRGE
jgi:hypothetical protein